VPISVNIASRHLQEPNFVDRVHRILDEHPDADPSALEIEILETGAIQDFAHARHVIDECRKAGLGVSLDDFGTGYSSLAYLSQLPATTIKIDQVFVRRLFEQEQDPAIIRAIVQIAGVFGCQVIAEGVEVVEHGLALLSMGCRFAQGFGIARPMPAEDVAAWARQHEGHPEWARYPRADWTPDVYVLLRARLHHRRWRESFGERMRRGGPFDAALRDVAGCAPARGPAPASPQSPRFDEAHRMHAEAHDALAAAAGRGARRTPTPAEREALVAGCDRLLAAIDAALRIRP
jgi:hypothetical protein